MTAPRPAKPPTLTEVIHLPDSAMAPAEPMPLAPDSMPLEELQTTAPAPPPSDLRPMRMDEIDAELLARLLDGLRPRLHDWLEAELRLALTEALPALSERIFATLRAQLDGELLQLLQHALSETRERRRGAP
jgi:hypothetical protein